MYCINMNITFPNPESLKLLSRNQAAFVTLFVLQSQCIFPTSSNRHVIEDEVCPNTCKVRIRKRRHTGHKPSQVCAKDFS